MGERFNSVILIDKLDKTRIFSLFLSNNSENLNASLDFSPKID